VGEGEVEAQKRLADAEPPGAFIDREPREAQHWERVRGDLPALHSGQHGRFERSRGHGREPEDRRAVDRHVRHADVVPELVLAGETLEEPVEVDVPRPKLRAVVTRCQSADDDGHGVSALRSGFLHERSHGSRGPSGPPQALRHPYEGLSAHDEPRGYDDVLGEVAQRLEVVEKGILDDVTLLEAARLGESLELELRSSGDVGGDLYGGHGGYLSTKR
jgi:hypothetical protein